MNRLIWVDLETTGLAEDNDFILELALVITDEDLNVQESFSQLIKPESLNLLDIHDYVVKMHFRNGLFMDVMEKGRSPQHVKCDALEFLDKCKVKEGEYPMCGCSVQFDRRFLKQDMPEIERRFHYRNIDVSTVRRLFRIWFPDREEYKKKDVHRALPDAHDSIEELKYYRGIINR